MRTSRRPTFVARVKSATSVSRFASGSRRGSAVVYCVDDRKSLPRVIREQAEGDESWFTATKVLMIVWTCIGLMPLLLQADSYLRFVTPHKISDDLVVPASAIKHTANMETLCPMTGLEIAQTWWNVGVTYYYHVKHGRVCHFVVPQYNIHGAYVLGSKPGPPSSTTPASCAENSYYLDYYFYHGSIGYYAFYEEAGGTFCASDNIGYVHVRGLGTYDSNGESLATDVGDSSYRRSYWYGFFGSIWIFYRSNVLRRSFVSCQRYGRRCKNLHESMAFKDAVVYVQESMRLSAHGARNYHRAALLYLLVEGLMSDLFLLIAQDGLLAKLQYISLGYNLSGVLSILFEMVEATNWMGETPRCFIKRLLFNYETSLLGECICSAAMHAYLTSLNRSSLKESKPVAEAVSYYVWSLVGHGIIVLGIVFVITATRSLGAVISVRWVHGSLALLLAPCCVDTTLGARCKMILLSGYVWEDGRLCYKADTLKAFGLMKMVEDDGAHYMAQYKLHWMAIPRTDLVVIGQIDGHIVTRCSERACLGVVSMIGRTLGGSTPNSSPTRAALQQLQWNDCNSMEWMVVKSTSFCTLKHPGGSSHFDVYHLESAPLVHMRERSSRRLALVLTATIVATSLFMVQVVAFAHPWELGVATHSKHSQVWSSSFKGLPVAATLSNPQIPTDSGHHRVVLHSRGYIHYGAISLGTPPQTFNVAFDVMTSDVWVPAQTPGAHHLYNHSASSTYQANGSYFNSPYVTGILSGDVLGIGDVEMPSQFFGEASDTSRLGPGYPYAPYDGIFGLGFDAASQAGVETPLHHLLCLGLLESKMFSLYIGRSGNLGELLLGSYDASRFKGELVYINTVSPNVWAVRLDEVQVGETTMSVDSAATFFTMGAYIFGPSEAISSVAKTLGAKEEAPGVGMYSIDCESSPPEITFVLNGHAFSISKEEYMLRVGEKCMLAFVGGIPSWVLGTAFLGKYYAVFDMSGNAPRIGLALAN